MQGGSAQQQELWTQLNRHLDGIKATWSEVKGDPAAVKEAIIKASSTSHDLKVAADKLGATVDQWLGELTWRGGVAEASRRELTLIRRGLTALADSLEAPRHADPRTRPGGPVPASLVDRFNIVEAVLRRAAGEVETVGKGFVEYANDLIMQAVTFEFLRRIQAEYAGTMEGWNAAVVAGRLEQELSTVAEGFPPVPPRQPRGPEPDISVNITSRSNALASAVAELRTQAATLTGIADQYLATSSLRPFVFSQSRSGRRLEDLYEDFRRDLVDRIRRLADRIELQAKYIGTFQLGLDKVQTRTVASFRQIDTQLGGSGTPSTSSG